MIFPERNAEEFAKCLRTLMTERAALEVCGERTKMGRARVSLAAVAKKMAATLKRLRSCSEERLTSPAGLL
jgi:hypothetical protein